MPNYKDTLKAKIAAMQKVIEAAKAVSEETKQGKSQAQTKQTVK